MPRATNDEENSLELSLLSFSSLQHFEESQTNQFANITNSISNGIARGKLFLRRSMLGGIKLSCLSSTTLFYIGFFVPSVNEIQTVYYYFPNVMLYGLIAGAAVEGGMTLSNKLDTILRPW